MKAICRAYPPMLTLLVFGIVAATNFSSWGAVGVAGGGVGVG